MSTTLRTMTILGLVTLLATPVMAEEGVGQGRAREGGRAPRERQGAVNERVQRRQERRNNEPRPGEAQLREFREKQRQALKTHLGTQKNENREFREGLKDTDPKEAIGKIREHRTKQHEENLAFLTAQKEEALTAIPRILGEAGVPAENIDKMVAGATARFDDMLKRMTESHAALLAALDRLAAQENVTLEDIRRAIREDMAVRPGARPRPRPGEGRGPRRERRELRERRGEGRDPVKEGGEKKGVLL